MKALLRYSQVQQAYCSFYNAWSIKDFYPCDAISSKLCGRAMIYVCSRGYPEMSEGDIQIQELYYLPSVYK